MNQQRTAQTLQPSLEEIVALGMEDSIFFSRQFFPKTIRQQSPPFHREIWDLIDGKDRLVNIQVFRGGAKTTLLRVYAAKRIAYGLAHTILYIGKSEGHAIRSVKWLRRQIEYNNPFAQVFGLRKGDKWQDIECEVYHGTDRYPIWIMAMGITGSIRGINQDDFRPDLIIVDDVIDEENSATPEQRDKISNLIHGALKESLTPASESVDAKMVMLQTPLNREDASTVALKDDEWVSATFGCWTAASRDLPNEKQESIWPERWASEVLRSEKSAAVKRNKLSLWMREKECRIVSPESTAFKADWLEYYELLPEHHQMRIVMAIDPVPPPSDIQIAKGMQKKDYEVLAVVGKYDGDFYLLEYASNRGHEPNWTVSEFMRLARKWKPRMVLVEGVAYQRTLAWILKQEMQRQGRYYAVHAFDDKRKKFDRIVDCLSGPASEGHLFVDPTQGDFIQQFTEYPAVTHEDVLEAVAVGDVPA